MVNVDDVYTDNPAYCRYNQSHFQGTDEKPYLERSNNQFLDRLVAVLPVILSTGLDGRGAKQR